LKTTDLGSPGLAKIAAQIFEVEHAPAVRDSATWMIF
jgi:hypothetical protein